MARKQQYKDRIADALDLGVCFGCGLLIAVFVVSLGVYKADGVWIWGGHVYQSPFFYVPVLLYLLSRGFRAVVSETSTMFLPAITRWSQEGSQSIGMFKAFSVGILNELMHGVPFITIAALLIDLVV